MNYNFETLTKAIVLNKEVENKTQDLLNSDPIFNNPEKYFGVLKDSKTDFTKLQNELNDVDGFKLLGLELLCALETQKDYKDIGISEKIYIDTFKCFSRFIEESYELYGKYKFDRFYWLHHQLNANLFRIGELEYEIKNEEREISLHIPSDANLSIQKVLTSISKAKKFFLKYFKETKNYSYSCYSYLLMPNMKYFLKSPSNILNFQKIFKICKVNYEDTSYLQRIFKTKNPDIASLKEDTRLQRGLKQYLLSGHRFGSALGYINFLKLEEMNIWSISFYLL